MNQPLIGARRVRLQLEAPVETPNESGGAAISYSTIATLWGEIQALTSREPVEAGHAFGEISTRITVPFRPEIDARMRLRAGLRLFEIQSAYDPDGRRRFTRCDTVEITP
jgi:SPP1 family predicted phage head-tail adaptor